LSGQRFRPDYGPRSLESWKQVKRFQVDSNLWGNWRSAAGSKDFQ